MEEEVEIRAPEATKGVTLDPKEVPPSLQEVPPSPSSLHGPSWLCSVSAAVLRLHAACSSVQPPVRHAAAAILWRRTSWRTSGTTWTFPGSRRTFSSALPATLSSSWLWSSSSTTRISGADCEVN